MNWKEFYLLPEGRVTRGEWWQWLFLPTFGITLVTIILDNIFGWTFGYWPWGILTMLASWFLAYPTIFVSVKRLHDLNKTGWWYLFYVIPGAGWIWSFVELGCLRGTVGANRYGPDPSPYYTAMKAGPRNI
jgi:uncharacterized membrane protein YhaH (DUF805 family)